MNQWTEFIYYMGFLFGVAWVLNRGTMWILKRRAAKAAGHVLSPAKIDARAIALADALHGVDRTALRLGLFAKFGFTAEDMVSIRTELGDNPEFVMVALSEFASGRFAPALPDSEPMAALTPDGACLWIRSALAREHNEWGGGLYSGLDLGSALRRHGKYLHSGDLTFTAWAYAAGMSPDETLARWRSGNHEVTESMRTLAAFSECDIGHPIPVPSNR